MRQPCESIKRLISKEAPVTIYTTSDNKYKDGGEDQWIKRAIVPAGAKSYEVDLRELPVSRFHKFVLVSPNNDLNR